MVRKGGSKTNISKLGSCIPRTCAIHVGPHSWAPEAPSPIAFLLSVLLVNGTGVRFNLVSVQALESRSSSNHHLTPSLLPRTLGTCLRLSPHEEDTPPSGHSVRSSRASARTIVFVASHRAAPLGAPSPTAACLPLMVPEEEADAS